MMKSASLHPQETERINALKFLNILDTDPEDAFDELTELAAKICNCPMALISLVDEKRQWFKSKFGLNATETPRDIAFCAHAILQEKDLFYIPDAKKDERFFDNPIVVGEPHVNFYAGFPILDPHRGLPIGTFCVIDNKPRTLDDFQKRTLEILKKQVENLLTLRAELKRKNKREKEILELSLRQEYILEGAGLGSWDWWLDSNKVTFDKRWSKMIGLDPENTTQELSTWDSRVHPDDKAKAYEDIKAHLEGRTEVYENVHRMRHSNGEWVWILDRGRISERDESGKPVRFTGTHLDITDYKVKEFLSNEIQKIALIGGWELNLQSQKTKWTSQTYDIHSIPESISTDKIMGIDFYLPHEREKLIKLISECALGKKFHQVFEFKDSKNHQKWVDVTGLPVKNAEGHITSLIGTIQDVSEKVKQRKELDEVQLRIAQNAKLASLGEMAAGVAHEINNPVAIISVSAQFLKKIVPQDEKIISKIETILKSVQRISKIVSGMRNFSRTSDLSERKESSLFEILKESLSIIETNPKLKNVNISTEAQSNGPILCNSIEIEQVIINLLNNAIDAAFATEEKWVKVQIFEKNNEEIIMRITDSGNGISAEVERKIFDPFFTTKPVGQGTGLGLSICKGILDNHEAKISINKSFKNTCFEIIFKKQVSIKQAV